MKVLLVSVNSEVCDLQEEQIAKQFPLAQCTKASSPQQALKLSKQQKFDVLVTGKHFSRLLPSGHFVESNMSGADLAAVSGIPLKILMTSAPVSFIERKVFNRYVNTLGADPLERMLLSLHDLMESQR